MYSCLQNHWRTRLARPRRKIKILNEGKKGEISQTLDTYTRIITYILSLQLFTLKSLYLILYSILIINKV